MYTYTYTYIYVVYAYTYCYICSPFPSGNLQSSLKYSPKASDAYSEIP